MAQYSPENHFVCPTTFFDIPYDHNGITPADPCPTCPNGGYSPRRGACCICGRRGDHFYCCGQCHKLYCPDCWHQ